MVENYYCRVEMVITNREMVSKLGFTLGQIKTWAGLVCDQDPQAGQGAGVARSYDMDSAFKVFLCGSLINELGIGLRQAAECLNWLWPHLDKLKLLPKYQVKGKDYLRGCLGIDIFIFPNPEVHCQIRWRIEEQYQTNNITENYKLQWIPETNNPLGPYWQYNKSSIIYRIEFDHYLTIFLELFAP